MSRHRRGTHKRGHTPPGTYLIHHQEQLAFARDNRVFIHPLGPGNSTIANRLEEHDPTTGKALGRYSPDGLEFRCPACQHIYTVGALDLVLWHRYVSQTGPLLLSCSHCRGHAPILKIYRHPENGQDWIEVYEGAI